MKKETKKLLEKSNKLTQEFEQLYDERWVRMPPSERRMHKMIDREMEIKRKAEWRRAKKLEKGLNKRDLELRQMLLEFLPLASMAASCLVDMSPRHIESRKILYKNSMSMLNKIHKRATENDIKHVLTKEEYKRFVEAGGVKEH